MIIKLRKIFRVTGLSQFDYEKLQNELKTGTMLLLKPQPENRYDTNAIGVYYTNQEPIGWIPKGDNPPISRIFKDTRIRDSLAKVVVHQPTSPKYQSLLSIQTSFEYDLEPLTPKGKDEVVAYFKSQGFEISNFPALNAAGIWDAKIWGENAPDLSTVKITNPCSEIRITDTTTAYNAVANFNSRNTVNSLQLNGTIGLDDAARKSLKSELKKDSTMSKIVDTNKQVATQAAFQEAGRIFLNQVTKVISKQAPLMIKGYVDTPAGKLAIANATVLAVQHFRPADQRLNRLANAALVQAYQEVYKAFDIEKFIEGFLDNDTIKTALKAVDSQDE